MNIYEKVLKIRNEVGTLNKDIVVSKDEKGKSYSAISESAVVEALNPLLEKYGVLVYVLLCESMTYNGKDEDEKGTFKQHYAKVDMKVQFQSIEDKEDYFTVASCGEGYDAGDKAIGKAYTYAYKYALLKTFGLLFSDDTDAWVSKRQYTKLKTTTQKPDLASEKQLAWVKSLLNELSLNYGAICEELMISGNEAKDVNKISVETANRLIKHLRQLKEDKDNEELPF